MNKQFLAQTLKDNWYLVLAVLVCFAAIGYRLVTPQEAESPAATTGERPVSAGQPLVLPPAPPAVATREEQVLEMIDDYRQRVQTDPQHPDAPATLMAIGNLYRDRLMDCAQAAAYYEQAIAEYPESTSRRDIYIQLADCYDRTGNFDMRDAVYREMLAYFPPDSEEYLYARQQLPE